VLGYICFNFTRRLLPRVLGKHKLTIANWPAEKAEPGKLRTDKFAVLEDARNYMVFRFPALQF